MPNFKGILQLGLSKIIPDDLRILFILFSHLAIEIQIIPYFHWGRVSVHRQNNSANEFISQIVVLFDLLLFLFLKPGGNH
jgi:hypothetical protein